MKMKLIRNQPKQDPVKAATYNPKEFRGRKPEGFLRASPERPPNPPFRWISFILLTALIAGGAYLWNGHAQTQGGSLPVNRGITVIANSPAPSPVIVHPSAATVPSPLPTPIQERRRADVLPGGALDVRRSAKGYVTPGSVNGMPVSFVVDTGASHLSLSAELAQKAGVRCQQQTQHSTANGFVTGCKGIAAEVVFGPFRLTNIEVSVLPNITDGALLGMDVLGRFGMVWVGDVVKIMALNAPVSNMAPEQTAAQPVAMPHTGDTRLFRQNAPGTAFAPLKLIGNRDGKHCLVRLEDWQTEVPVLDVFVRNGEVTETNVALGQYRAKIACGSTWYGAQLFGPAAPMSQLAQPVQFIRNANGGTTGMQISLTQRMGGNLQTQ